MATERQILAVLQSARADHTRFVTLGDELDLQRAEDLYALAVELSGREQPGLEQPSFTAWAKMTVDGKFRFAEKRVRRCDACDCDTPVGDRCSCECHPACATCHGAPFFDGTATMKRVPCPACGVRR